MDILRFITAGNVDDGKSTLIGRLLYDTNNIKHDILQAVSGSDGVSNLAHITDGLRAERQQGITIDVAYKYFTTEHRKYIITDAPGHFQYTKNLVTGASGVDAMIILIDAQNGITEQTRRHSLVGSFLQTGHIVVAINKMDIVGYSEQVFETIKNEYLEIAEKLTLQNVSFIPMSALCGDNVLLRSENMKWYKGKTLMQYLDKCEPVTAKSDALRFSVQYIIEGQEKGYAGKMLSGNLDVKDNVATFPGEQSRTIGRIVSGYSDVQMATAGQNVVLYFINDLSASRGDIISRFHKAPKCNKVFEATVCWLNIDEPLKIGKEYFLRINSKETVCSISEILFKTDINSFEKYNDENALDVNQFARVKIETKDLIPYDEFSELPENGRGIIIDTETNYTSGAFVIEKVIPKQKDTE